jgi:hypothetical protein
MIEQPAVERFGRAREPPRRADVGIARTGISARVVMGEEDGRASVHRRVDDNIAKWKLDSARVAQVVGEMEAAAPGVEMCDPKTFLRGMLFFETASEEGSGGGEAVECHWDDGMLMTHPALLRNAIPCRDANLVGSGGQPVHFAGIDATSPLLAKKSQLPLHKP